MSATSRQMALDEARRILAAWDATRGEGFGAVLDHMDPDGAPHDGDFASAELVGALIWICQEFVAAEEVAA